MQLPSCIQSMHGYINIYGKILQIKTACNKFTSNPLMIKIIIKRKLVRR